MSKKNQQPGVANYFLGRGYDNLKSRLIWLWNENLNSAKEQFSIIDEKGYISVVRSPRFLASVFIIFFGSIILALMAVFRGFFLSILYVFASIWLAIIWSIDRIYNNINKISNACPNPSCQASFTVPSYECPNCGAKHSKLVPGKYGILRRKCVCGTKLPCTFFAGKGKLSAHCPKCSCSLEGDTAVRQYAIPVIGGPSVGKTCYINMLIQQMFEKVAPVNNWNFEFLSNKNKERHRQIASNMQKGIRPFKTELEALTAYQMMLKLPNNKFGRRIYIYDISGEKFSKSEDIQRNIAYSYADGMIFIVDPLSLSRYAFEMENKINLDKYSASAKSTDDILNVMLINLEKMFLKTSKDLLDVNLAIVINKVDIPGLEEKIGLTAANRYMQTHIKCNNIYQAQNIVCEKFLETYGAGNFVRSVSSKFRNFQYFTCSALGHSEEGIPFKAKGVEMPLLWILKQVDNNIDAKII